MTYSRLNSKNNIDSHLWVVKHGLRIERIVYLISFLLITFLTFQKMSKVFISEIFSTP